MNDCVQKLLEKSEADFYLCNKPETSSQSSGDFRGFLYLWLDFVTFLLSVLFLEWLPVPGPCVYTHLAFSTTLVLPCVLGSRA